MLDKLASVMRPQTKKAGEPNILSVSWPDFGQLLKCIGWILCLRWLMDPPKVGANCFYVPRCVVLLWVRVGHRMVSSTLSEGPLLVTGRILAMQVLFRLTCEYFGTRNKGRIIPWTVSVCGNLEELDIANVPLFFWSFVAEVQLTGQCLFLSLKLSFFHHFLPFKILEPQDFEFCFSFVLPLHVLVQKSEVHKLFITHPIHEFRFPFKFYECFLC